MRAPLGRGRHAGIGQAVTLPVRPFVEVCLVDATAVKSVLNKGRTSAPTLRKAVTCHAIVSLAGDVRVRYAYILSEDNSADKASGGFPPLRRRMGMRPS